MEDFKYVIGLPNTKVNKNAVFIREAVSVSRVSKLGKTYNTVLPEQHLKPSNNETGYFKVKINVEGVVYRKYVHVAVWEAFNGVIPEGYEIDHIDCDKSNNNLSNLQLMTRKENMKKCHEDNPHIMEGLRKHSGVAVVYDKTCNFCGINYTSKRGHSKFCSSICSHKSLVRFSIEKEELQGLVNKYSISFVARTFKVSFHTVIKRCKELGVIRPSKV